jgi:tRNA threonylcarbamoyladenosine biosynthesis protein TsaB
MILLGIDTSSLHGSVAIVQDGSILFELHVDPPKSFSQKIFGAISRALDQTGTDLSQFDAIAVTVGPGSFTGLRVGLASALGLEMGLSKPVVGVRTLDAYSHIFPAADMDVCPVLDARKNEVYTAVYRYRNDTLEKIVEDRVVSPETLHEILSGPTVLYGDGVERYGGLWLDQMGDRVSFLQNPRSTVAAQAAILGQELFLTGTADRDTTAELFYIRKSEAEVRSGL